MADGQLDRPADPQGSPAGAVPDGLAGWLRAGAVAWVLLLVVVYLQLKVPAQDDPDVWWHLRTGQLIAEERAIPRADPFSFTKPGEPWVAHEWLSELILHGLDRAGGVGLVLLARSLCIGIGVALAWLHAARLVSPRGALLAALVAFAGSHSNWSARPHIFSWVLIGVTLTVLERWRRERGGRGPWLLPPLVLVWANLHGAFAVGLGLIGLYALGSWLPARDAPPARERWRLLGVLALGFAAACVNPIGPELLLYPLRYVTVDNTFIAEWQPTSARHTPVLVPLLLLLVGSLGLSRAPTPGAALFAVLVLLALSLKAVRHIQFLGLLLAYLLPEQMSSAAASIDAAIARWRGDPADEPPDPPAPGRDSLRASALPLLLLLLAGAASLLRPPEATVQFAPAAAVDALERADPDGRVFNEYGWGGYLIWRWHPRRKVFVDGREDMYGVPFCLEEYEATREAREGSLDRLERWRITSVLLPPGAPLLALLRARPDWREVHQDPHAVVMVRRP